MLGRCVSILIALVSAVAVARGEPAGFPLVDGGRQGVIVGRSLFLAGAVERCTGRRLRQAPEARFAPKAGEFPVYLGDTAKARELLAPEIAGLDVEGYILLVQPDLAIIYAGPARTDSGNPQLWAEADFARRFMGVDHYFPGPLGEVYPKAERLIVPCGKWVEQPAFKARQWSGAGLGGLPGWRVRLSGGGGRFQFHHNLWRIIDFRKYAGHPEYFPEIDGKRTIPTRSAGWQPCVTNPEVRRIAIEYVLKHLAGQADAGACSLGVNDSGGYCQCALCLADTPAGMDPKSAEAMAWRMYKFYGIVAEGVAARRPEARLGFLAYGATNAWRPEKLHPLLMPYLTTTQADCWDATYRAGQEARFTAWGKAAAHLGMYEWLYGGGFIVPRLYIKDFAAMLRHALSCGADGFYAEVYPNWGLEGPKLWVAEKLLWDPAQDPGALLDRWCAALFGEAAGPMREYFDRLERAWAEQRPSNAKRGGYRLMTSAFKTEQLTEVFPPAVCEEVWALIERAEAAARDDEQNLARVRFFKESFAATRIASRRCAAARALAALAKEEKARSAQEWLAAFDEWARLPALDDYMKDLRARHPAAFQEFCDPANAQPGKTVSFAAWDTDAPVTRRIVELLAAEALKPPAGRPPVGRSEFAGAADALLGAHAVRAREAGASCNAAARTLRPLLRSMAVDAQVPGDARVIDGLIEKAWGEPVFDGQFYVYPFEMQPAPERTRVWLAMREGKLYAAFHCLQEPRSVLGALAEDDAVALVERNGAKYLDLGKGLPYLGGVDSVGIALPGYRMIIVTSGGGVFDGQGGAYGVQVGRKGVTAKVRRTEEGWCAEMTIEVDAAFVREKCRGAARGFNFVRCRENTRSAWVPAAPQVWSVLPRTDGIVFFP
jgi:hypothetical protein